MNVATTQLHLGLEDKVESNFYEANNLGLEDKEGIRDFNRRGDQILGTRLA